MTDWTGGYVSDIEYVPGFYREQSPGHLDLACLMCGVEPPRRLGSGQEFTYCEIGCGQGTTVSALAAANPHGRFYAIDFMPAHIARAEDIKQRASLDNISFLEADIVDLAAGENSALPAFDYVTLHGVYAWVSPAVRKAIVAFLMRYLKPGGVVYVSYNALPAWSSFSPAQKLLFEYANTVQGPSDERVREGVAFIKRLKAAGASVIGGEAVDHILSFESKGRSEPERVVYLAHEFLNACWTPLYHSDVAADFAEAKLDFVGVASLQENFAGSYLSEEARAILDSLPDGPVRETTKDYFTGRGFRRDVFVRGRRTVGVEQRERLLSECLLAPAVTPSDVTYEGDVFTSKVELKRATYEPIFAALAEGPKPVEELLDLGHRHGGSLSATELVGLLVGLRQALPILCDVTTEGVEACARLNKLTAAEAMRASRRVSYVAATPVGHAGLNMSSVETLVLDGLFQGVPENVEALVDHVADRADIDPDAQAPSQGPGGPTTTLIPPENGGADTKRDETAEPEGLGRRLQKSVAWCLDEAVPFWRVLGIAPPPR